MPFFNQQAYRTAAGPIDEEAEKGWLMFRFTDFTETAQRKFVEHLKRDSSVYTIKRRAKTDDLLRVIRDLNPIMFHGGYNNSFSHSTFYRWREQGLSSMVFNSMFRRNPANVDSWRYKHILSTPRQALERMQRRIPCSGCGLLTNINDLDYSDRCDSCQRQSSPSSWFQAATRKGQEWRKHYANRKRNKRVP